MLTLRLTLALTLKLTLTSTVYVDIDVDAERETKVEIVVEVDVLNIQMCYLLNRRTSGYMNLMLSIIFPSCFSTPSSSFLRQLFQFCSSWFRCSLDREILISYNRFFSGLLNIFKPPFKNVLYCWAFIEVDIDVDFVVEVDAEGETKIDIVVGVDILNI